MHFPDDRSERARMEISRGAGIRNPARENRGGKDMEHGEESNGPLMTVQP